MADRRARGRQSWTAELVELAALFLAVATADAFANSLAHLRAGSVVLVGLGVLLIACALVHRWWLHRPPAREAGEVAAPPSPAPPSTAPSGKADAPVSGKVWRVRATVPDTPGSLAALTGSMAARDINILSVQVHALPHAAVDEFLVESAGDAERIHAAVAAGGGADIRVEPGDPHDLVDVPTRLLTMAGQDLAARRVDLPHALGVLLGDCELRWDATGEPAEGPDGTALRLADPAGGLLTITRPAAAFTPAEYARARALLALDEAIAELVRAGATTVLANGLTVRDADLADLAGIEAMHGRCGERTRSRRYLAGTTCPSPAILARMINRRTGRTLVAVHPDGDIVAMANLVLDGDTAEAAVLVEDAWQRQGIGTALLRRLTAGGGTAYAVTEPDNIPMLRALRHAGAELDRVEDGLAHLSFGRGRAPERAGPALPFPQAASRW